MQMPGDKRRSDGGSSNQPAVQVVGFHVEGQTPSPRPGSILHEDKKLISGSPVPVIIPPSFQVTHQLVDACCR
jgi:hypothetical protein